jgi:hypothetical protein
VVDAGLITVVVEIEGTDRPDLIGVGHVNNPFLADPDLWCTGKRSRPYDQHFANIITLYRNELFVNKRLLMNGPQGTGEVRPRAQRQRVPQ